jgi:hypothetical protein
MTVLKRVVSSCRNFFEALYYSTFRVERYGHIHCGCFINVVVFMDVLHELSDYVVACIFFIRIVI